MIIEVCAGSVADCLTAQQVGANRIELNSALHMGGLTPSLATVHLAQKKVSLPLICMVRPRGGGFCYSELEKEEMFLAATQFLTAGVAGIAFGFLHENGTIDYVATKRMIELCNAYHAESVFHRAIDCTADYRNSVEQLVALGCTRVLTSGGEATALKGSANIYQIQKEFDKKIEICMGCGVTAENVSELIQQTAIQQIHGSFKEWCTDPTTTMKEVSYRYSPNGDYEAVSPQQLKKAIDNIRGINHG